MSEKKNIYTCKNAHLTVTVDRDKGVTPALIACPVCNDLANSNFYHCPDWALPTHEWYKPASLDGLNVAEKEHIGNGGLLMRKIDRPALDPSVKPSQTILVEDLCEFAKSKEPNKYSLLILLAQSGGFDDFKSDTVVPEDWGWVCPKLALADICTQKHPELQHIYEKMVDGVYDDEMDAEDIERMRRETPQSMHKMLGL